MEHEISTLPQPEDAVPVSTASPGDPLAVLRSLGPGRILALGAIALALLGFFAYLVMRVSDAPYTLLFGGLELEDSNAIVGRLEAMGVPHRLSGDGQAVMVPADKALRLRMTFAEEGLPEGGSVGYEIFDESSPLGTSSFLANINLVRALEGELSRTVSAIAGVQTARVHLVQPKRELFRREQVEPSASITLRLRGGTRLAASQVQAIRHLIAAAVPGLAPERVTVVDDHGTLLARSGGEESGAVMPTRAAELRQAEEQHLKTMLEVLLERSVGPGRVRAEVSVEIDLDQVTTTVETFDPESQVARSTQSIEEQSELSERDADNSVSVSNNLPVAGAGGGAGIGSDETTSRIEETVNYEISRTVRNHTRQGGDIRRLSVAVLVDGRYEANESGELAYVPRSEGELAQLATLVRSAVGYSAERGDVVEVINMRFVRPAEVAMPEPPLFDLNAPELWRFAEIAAIAVIALLIGMLVIRPLIGRLLPAPGMTPALATAGGPSALLAAGSTRTGAEVKAAGNAMPPAQRPPAATPIASAPDRQGIAAISAQGEPIDGDERTREIRQVEGRVRVTLATQVAGIVENDPDDAVRVVRNWLHEG